MLVAVAVVTMVRCPLCAQGHLPPVVSRVVKGLFEDSGDRWCSPTHSAGVPQHQGMGGYMAVYRCAFSLSV